MQTKPKGNYFCPAKLNISVAYYNMEAGATLPLELWREVAISIEISGEYGPYIEAATYNLLVRASKRFIIPDAMKVFMRIESIIGGFVSKLPNGCRHSIDDQPAVFTAEQQEWYENGLLHRVGSPAIIQPGKTQAWFTLGRRRRGLPFMILEEGTQVFAEDDDIVSADKISDVLRSGKMQILGSDGNRSWYQNGIMSRGGGLPAGVTVNCSQQWQRESRGGLPTLIKADGSQRWFEGSHISAHKPARKPQIDWIEEWHQRGEMLNLTAEDVV